MHREGIGLGTALRELHDSERFSVEAVERRFFAAATASTVEELAVHLRRLISQLRTLPSPQALDYTMLLWDLERWHWPDRQQAVRRRWGLQYHASSRRKNSDSADPSQPAIAGADADE